jgi:hypothetical protein
MSRIAMKRTALAKVVGTVTLTVKKRIRMEVERQNRLQPLPWTEGAVIEQLAMDYLPPHPDEADASLNPPAIPAQLVKRKGIGKAKSKSKKKAVAA